MTQKHYIALASAIRQLRDKYPNAFVGLLGKFVIKVVAEAIADVCASDNSRFGREKFLLACGVVPGEKVRYDD